MYWFNWNFTPQDVDCICLWWDARLLVITFTSFRWWHFQWSQTSGLNVRRIRSLVKQWLAHTRSNIRLIITKRFWNEHWTIQKIKLNHLMVSWLMSIVYIRSMRWIRSSVLTGWSRLKGWTRMILRLPISMIIMRVVWRITSIIRRYESIRI